MKTNNIKNAWTVTGYLLSPILVNPKERERNLIEQIPELWLDVYNYNYREFNASKSNTLLKINYDNCKDSQINEKLIYFIDIDIILL